MDPSDQSSVAYWQPPEENPNFVSRPPDPGPLNFYKTLGEDALYHSPTSAVNRITSLNLEKQTDFSSLAGGIDMSPAFTPRILDPKEANEKYGMHGQLHFDEPITESAAQLMYQRKVDENDRDYQISSGSTSGFRNVSGFGVSMAASLLDPINLASMFVPVLGEERIAEAAKNFSTSPLMRRLAQGGLTGLSAQATLEPLILKANMDDQANYTLLDSAKNLGFGLAFGGLVHAGLGAIADRVRSLKPTQSAQLFETAMNSVLKDEPVVNPGKVEEFIDKKPESAIYSGQTARNGPWQDHWMVKMPGDEAPRSMTALEMRQEGIEVPHSGESINAPEGTPEITQDVGIDSLKAQLSDATDKIAEMKAQGVDTTQMEQMLEPTRQLIAMMDQAHQMVGDEPKPDLSNIPRTDPETGRVYSEPERLQMLQEQINGEKVQNDRIQKDQQMTKDNTSSSPKVDRDVTTETPKDTAEVMKQTEDLKKQTGLEGEDAKALDERIKEDVGDQAGREQGVNAAVDCIVKHLI